jgi:hypothetical protein
LPWVYFKVFMPDKDSANYKICEAIWLTNDATQTVCMSCFRIMVLTNCRIRDCCTRWDLCDTSVYKNIHLKLDCNDFHW